MVSIKSNFAPTPGGHLAISCRHFGMHNWVESRNEAEHKVTFHKKVWPQSANSAEFEKSWFNCSKINRLIHPFPKLGYTVWSKQKDSVIKKKKGEYIMDTANSDYRRSLFCIITCLKIFLFLHDTFFQYSINWSWSHFTSNNNHLPLLIIWPKALNMILQNHILW